MFRLLPLSRSQRAANALPADLVGTLIAVQPSGDDSFTTTVREVVERSARRVLVRDSGKPRQKSDHGVILT